MKKTFPAVSTATPLGVWKVLAVARTPSVGVWDQKTVLLNAIVVLMLAIVVIMPLLAVTFLTRLFPAM